MAQPLKTSNGEIALKWRLFGAVVYWVIESAIGLVPLVAALIVPIVSDSSRRLASCLKVGSEGNFQECHWVIHGLNAEKCILAIVLSGLAAFASLNHTDKADHVARKACRSLALLGLSAIVFVSAIVYTGTSTGVSKEPYDLVNALLGFALIGSVVLTIEREL